MAHSETRTDSARLFLDLAEQSQSIEEQIILSKKALLYGRHNSDTLIIANINNFLGTAYREIGIIDKSLSFYIDALALYKKINNLNGASNVLNNLGVIYGSRGQYEIALEHFKEAIKTKQQLNGSHQETAQYLMYLSGSFNNIGLIHDLIDQKDSALYYYDKSLQIRKSLNDYMGISGLYSNMGITYLSLKENTLAERYLMMSFQIADSLDDVSLFVNAAYNLADFYFSQGDITNAEKYLDKCYLRAESFGAKDLMMSVFDLKSKISFETGKYKNGYIYLKQYTKLKDSLINVNTESRIAKLQISHEAQRKEERIQFLEKQNKLEIQGNRLKKTLLNFLFVALFIALILIFIFYYQKKKLSFVNKELVKRNLEILSIDTKPNYNHPDKKYASSSLSTNKKQKVLSQLDDLMNNKKIFLKTDLTIDILSNELSISRTYLSQIINETFGTNFTAYINNQRINYSMKLLSDSENEKYSIAGIAKMSGFKSISSFNTLFKQKTGLTPSAFKNIASGNKHT